MLDIKDATEEITFWDLTVFEKLISLDLTAAQVDCIIHPELCFEDEESVLAIHWHPEMVNTSMAVARIKAMFPCATESLIIPTQHNNIMTCGSYAGAEVDCRASAFNRKIQILLHFEKNKIEGAHTLRTMIAHTGKYRSTQLFEFMAAMCDPSFENLLQEAARNTGAEENLIRFAAIQIRKLRRMIEEHPFNIDELSLKNKLLINYLNSQRDLYDGHIIDRTVIFAYGVKEIVKRRFRLDYFYEVREIIEETRALGGGVIVPHPEQFWPVLLADYDVDGYEVWNPQSREYTEFLIQVVIKKNMTVTGRMRPLLVVMGDDAHLGEKILVPEMQSPEKASREVGYQPAWQDPAIRESLKAGNFDKEKVISDYKERLH
jgi:hypothetical protein